mmetsp:Transcript_56148/g.109932  ORF Transcript_56148/g.109932 Transcript_56148/m.109932 type:complete len:122 (+) Transcript_56148:323-688(+)
MFPFQLHAALLGGRKGGTKRSPPPFLTRVDGGREEQTDHVMEGRKKGIESGDTHIATGVTNVSLCTVPPPVPNAGTEEKEETNQRGKTESRSNVCKQPDPLSPNTHDQRGVYEGETGKGLG